LRRDEEVAWGWWWWRRRRRREAAAAWRAGYRRGHPAPSPEPRRESGAREGAYRREGEEGMRSFLKKNQELEYIFAPPDSHEKPEKLAKSI